MYPPCPGSKSMTVPGNRTFVLAENIFYKQLTTSTIVDVKCSVCIVLCVSCALLLNTEN